VHRAVGGITENDITLASATNATLIGFNVRPDRKARELAESEEVEIRTYEIIYKLLEDIEQGHGRPARPEYEEVVTGEAEVREVFRVPRIGAVAGCLVRSGTITAGSKVASSATASSSGRARSSRCAASRTTSARSARASSAASGLSDFQDLKGGDLIETYEEREIARV
jgi:translation initiation factor IF-2